jgi:hypothetical protein
MAWRILASDLAGRRNEAMALAENIAGKHPSEYIHPLAHVLIGIGLGDRAATLGALGALYDVQICAIEQQTVGAANGVTTREIASTHIDRDRIEGCRIDQRGCDPSMPVDARRAVNYR